MDLALKNKNVVITGGSRGIGHAIAALMVNEGAKVAFCARSAEGVDKAKRELSRPTNTVYAEAIDVRNEAAFAGWFNNAASALGGVDVIISNVSTRDDLSANNRWRDTFEVDLHQHVRFFDLALPHLKKNKAGAAVFIASIASVLTQLPPEELAYGP